MAVIIIEDNVWLTIVYNSPLAPQRVRFAPQNRLFESAECTELLNLEDSGIYVSNIQIIDTKKIITVET